MNAGTQTVQPFLNVPPGPRVSIAEARALCKRVGTQLRWRPDSSLSEEQQYAVVMGG